VDLFDNCDLCAREAGEHDFGRACCRSRFLLAQRHIDVRRNWLEIFRKDYGEQAAAETEARVRAGWKR
jgi:hypothetical protein